MKRVVKYLIMFGYSLQATEGVSFVSTSLDNFIQKTVPEKEQTSFKTYYQALQSNIDHEQVEKRKETRQYIYNKGLEALARDHKKEHKKLTKLFSVNYLDESYDGERSEARQFVYWYGTFEAYSEAQSHEAPTMQTAQHPLKEKSGVMERTKLFTNQAKSYVAKATQKVGNWWKNLRSRVS